MCTSIGIHILEVLTKKQVNHVYYGSKSLHLRHTLSFGIIMVEKYNKDLASGFESQDFFLKRDDVFCFVLEVPDFNSVFSLCC